MEPRKQIALSAAVAGTIAGALVLALVLSGRPDRSPVVVGPVAGTVVGAEIGGLIRGRRKPQWPLFACGHAAGSEDVEMDCPPGLRLEIIDEHNWRAALAVQVSPDQLRFVAGYQPVALIILAKSYVRPSGLDWEPLALCSGTSVAGVLALAHAPAHSELLHLAIDAAKQGQGCGAAAVKLALAHVAATRPTSREVRLTVHPDNARAQRLYRSGGFLTTGQTRDGEPVWTLPLKRPVLAAPEDQASGS